MYRSIASAFTSTARIGELQIQHAIEASRLRLASGEGQSLLLLEWANHPFQGEDWLDEMDPVVIVETTGMTTFGTLCRLGCCTQLRVAPTGHRFIRLRSDILPNETAAVAGLRRLPPGRNICSSCGVVQEALQAYTTRRTADHTAAAVGAARSDATPYLMKVMMK